MHSDYKPVKTYKFPAHDEYGKQRSFQFCWLEECLWLVYSPQHDGAYCKVCALFGKETVYKNSAELDRLVKSPITFWTTASQKFKDHAIKSQVHKTASLMLEEFLKVMQSKLKPIDQQLKSSLAIQIAENKQKLFCIVKTAVFCGRHNIPLRGHCKSESSQNPGIFKSLLRFRVESADDVLKNQLVKIQFIHQILYNMVSF